MLTNSCYIASRSLNFGSGDGLSYFRHLAINWTNADIFFSGQSGINWRLIGKHSSNRLFSNGRVIFTNRNDNLIDTREPRQKRQNLPQNWTGGRCLDWSLQWRHNEPNSVSNHQPRDCLLNRLFRRRSKKTSKLRVTGLCVGNSPVTGEFPAQMASNAENASIWWRHHVHDIKYSSNAISCNTHPT